MTREVDATIRPTTHDHLLHTPGLTTVTHCTTVFLSLTQNHLYHHKKWTTPTQNTFIPWLNLRPLQHMFLLFQDYSHQTDKFYATTAQPQATSHSTTANLLTAAKHPAFSTNQLADIDKPAHNYKKNLNNRVRCTTTASEIAAWCRSRQATFTLIQVRPAQVKGCTIF